MKLNTLFLTVTCAVKEDTLTDMVSCLSESTGLVHQMPFVCDREGFSGVLEKVILSFMFSPLTRVFITVSI